jgi:hypothetical protein
LKSNFHFLIISNLTTSTKVAQDITSKQNILLTFSNLTRYDYNLTIEMKMETGRNFSMLEINSGHHNLPTYGMSLKSDIVEFVQYCGGHFENGDR